MGFGIRTFIFAKLNERKITRFSDDYVDWRVKRQLAILDHYGHNFFKSKTVLELGAGYGDIGAFFSGLGATVSCVEGRSKNTRVIHSRYPHLKAITCDLSREWPDTNHYNVILHLGVLYHLSNPEENLRTACQHCDHLVLETETCDSSDPHKVTPIQEADYCFDQAVDGRGSKPSQAFVERILVEGGMQFERITDDRCNSGQHIYDWPLTNTGRCKNGQRRMWFVNRR